MINPDALLTLPYGMYVVCSGNKEFGNGFLSNVVFQVTAEPPRLGVSCNKDNFTANMILESKSFSISLLSQNTPADVIRKFGYQSGKVNKQKMQGCSIKYGNCNVPIFLDHVISYFDCKLTQTIEIGTHYIFIGEVVEATLLDNETDAMTYAYYRNVMKGKSPKNAPTYIDKSININLKTKNMSTLKKYECDVCGYVYDPAIGDEDAGIKPGTDFEDLPDDWVCPLCGVGKDNFTLID